MKTQIIEKILSDIKYMKQIEDFTIDDIKYNENILKHLKNNNKRFKKKQLLKLFASTSDKRLFVYGTKLYEDNNVYGELFRVFDLTNRESDDLYDDIEKIKLFSYKDTIEFIKENVEYCYGNKYYSNEENKIITLNIDFQLLKKYWKEYPNSIIVFG